MGVDSEPAATDPDTTSDAETVRVLFVDDEESIVEVAATFLERLREEFVVHTETSATAAIERLEDGAAVDCVVSDYLMPEMDGLAFLERVRDERPDVPFILSTGRGSEEVASDAISAGVTDYLRKDTGTDQYEVLANRIANAVDQHRAERALEEREHRLAAQRDELATLDRINIVIQELIQGLVDAATRAEIERIICERIAASELYQFAWIAEHGTSDRLALRTGASVDAPGMGPIPTDGVEMRLGERALETGSVEVLEDVLADSPDSWRIDAREQGHRSVAAIPLAYQDVIYGVLAVSATRQEAFSEREQAGFAVLGEVAGFAINAAQNMKLLLSDTAVALELRVTDDAAFPVALASRLDCRYSLDGIVPASDGALLQYVTIEDADPERVLDRAAASSGVVEHRLVDDLDEDDEGGVFEFTTRSSPANTVIGVGGTVRDLTADDGEARMTVEVAADADVRRVVDALDGAYPGTELLSKRAVELPLGTERGFRQSVHETLTEKQRTALRAAYFAGYYDWPRRSTAEELAGSIGVSSPTLHNHLRKAHRKLLVAFLGDEADG